jgi:2-polyprenyl-3-methyl-5-hydroxy-6-metoxy-1,4-benzoquinol methylase
MEQGRDQRQRDVVGWPTRSSRTGDWPRSMTGLDSDRSDLAAYAALGDEFSARSVLDIGCGTGTFACILAGRGVRVIGVDPARASLDVARAKPGADRCSGFSAV